MTQIVLDTAVALALIQFKPMEVLQLTALVHIHVLICDGLFSCSEVATLYNTQGSIRCYGESSCTHTTIINNGSTSSTNCRGAKACSNSVIYNRQTATANGFASAFNTTFESLESGARYNFYGITSAHSAKIICNHGHICQINCWGTSCNNLTLITKGNASFDIDCFSATKSDACPNGYDLESLLTQYGIEESQFLPDLLSSNVSLRLSSFENSYNTCYPDLDIVNSINCDDWQECYAQPIDTTITLPNTSHTTDIDSQQMVGVCCTAYEGCRLATDILINLTNTEPHLYSASVIRCDGGYSCNSVNSGIDAMNGGNMYFTGYWSAAYGDHITTTQDYDIFCTGDSSCLGVGTIQNAQNLYCLGVSSCYNVDTIENIKQSVWSYGSQTTRFAIIRNVGLNVYCGAYYSCASTYIVNVTNSIHGTGDNAIASGTVDGIGNNVIGFGDNVMRQSVIMNVVNNVIGRGYRAFYQANIINVGNDLVAVGDHSLYLANITNVTNVCVSILYIQLTII